MAAGMGLLALGFLVVRAGGFVGAGLVQLALQ